MTLKELERCFNRAILYCFSYKKMMLVYPPLVLCGVLITFCRAVAFDASDWIAMSFIFLPIFLSCAILSVLGTLLIKIYHHEIKKIKINFRKILTSSLSFLLGGGSMAIISILVYIPLWIALGIYIFLREIPAIGGFIAVLLAFVPFLLILFSILLIVFNFAFLFFAMPIVALRKKGKFKLMKSVISHLKKNIFVNLFLFLLVILLIGLVVGILSIAALLAHYSFIDARSSVSLAVEWFFMMLPISGILMPVVIFFFNFAAEAYMIVQEKFE